jgi:peptide-methionine (S)-S-oxide reductase
VAEVESGYIGGHADNPTYKAVCSGVTGHAEAIRITFDPAVISYADLLDVHFATHDPTQLNRQGNDVGTQYRSAIFPLDDTQQGEARAAIARAQRPTGRRPSSPPSKATDWWPAEDYHQRILGG